mmetsp:Transcript_28935/g.84823  ORF Transcript_28935/g.84823 Transcript_28935/m.84823 type:complete len:246 (+) Transcript_28935:250-987(+)
MVGDDCRSCVGPSIRKWSRPRGCMHGPALQCTGALAASCGSQRRSGLNLRGGQQEGRHKLPESASSLPALLEIFLDLLVLHREAVAALRRHGVAVAKARVVAREGVHGGVEGVERLCARILGLAAVVGDKVVHLTADLDHGVLKARSAAREVGCEPHVLYQVLRIREIVLGELVIRRKHLLDVERAGGDCASRGRDGHTAGHARGRVHGHGRHVGRRGRTGAHVRGRAGREGRRRGERGEDQGER